jgi:hypothetical protein
VPHLSTTLSRNIKRPLGGSKMVSTGINQVRGGSLMEKMISIAQRIFAVFLASGLSVIGAGAIIGIDTIKAVILAGTLGVVTVVEQLARSFLVDGKLSASEINEAFADVDGKTSARKGK